MLIDEHLIKQAACVFCNGGKDKNHTCEQGCNGCGDCEKVCEENAIHINDNGLAVVDEDKCIACGACVKACQRKIIRIKPVGSYIAPLCSNTAMGKDAIAACDSCCIACRACERVCPAGAIKVMDNHARIAYKMCVGCGACISVCKRNVLWDRRGIMTPRTDDR